MPLPHEAILRFRLFLSTRWCISPSLVAFGHSWYREMHQCVLRKSPTLELPHVEKIHFFSKFFLSHFFLFFLQNSSSSYLHFHLYHTCCKSFDILYKPFLDHISFYLFCNNFLLLRLCIPFSLYIHNHNKINPNPNRQSLFKL